MLVISLSAAWIGDLAAALIINEIHRDNLTWATFLADLALAYPQVAHCYYYITLLCSYFIFQLNFNQKD